MGYTFAFVIKNKGIMSAQELLIFTQESEIAALINDLGLEIC